MAPMGEFTGENHCWPKRTKSMMYKKFFFSFFVGPHCYYGLECNASVSHSLHCLGFVCLCLIWLWPESWAAVCILSILSSELKNKHTQHTSRPIENQLGVEDSGLQLGHETCAAVTHCTNTSKTNMKSCEKSHLKHGANCYTFGLKNDFFPNVALYREYIVHQHPHMRKHFL